MEERTEGGKGVIKAGMSKLEKVMFGWAELISCLFKMAKRLFFFLQVLRAFLRKAELLTKHSTQEHADTATLNSLARKYKVTQLEREHSFNIFLLQVCDLSLTTGQHYGI